MDLWIDNENTNPSWNLAAEEYLITSRSDTVYMLWRNRASVIIGRNQDLHAEVDVDEAGRRGFPVVRRLSGGGAVFHDLGNINFTWIFNEKGRHEQDFAPFARKISDALARLGVRAELSGRNDILVDGKKISGCAHVAHKGRVMYHGTLLFSADLSQMEGLLRYSEEKYRDKGVKSVSARVVNLSAYLTDMNAEEFMDTMRRLLRGGEEPYGFSEQDKAAITRLAESKYTHPTWLEMAKNPL